MDGPPLWDDSTLFSPSKARAQQAQAKEWASVDAWLSKKYASKRFPPFERNEETLLALLTLATLNDSADEQRSLIDRVEKAALQALSRRKASSSVDDADALSVLMKELEGNPVLDALAETAVCLDCPDVGMSRLANAVVDLTNQKFTAEQQVLRVESQLRALKSEQDKVRRIIEDLKRDDFQPRSDLAAQTTEWIRNTKQLKAKVGEYDDRLKGLSGVQLPPVRLEDVKALMQELATQHARLTELHAQLTAFQSLPTDANAARKKLESAREELRGLVKQRDQLFEGLVDAG